jgi:hypothetical protein
MILVPQRELPMNGIHAVTVLHYLLLISCGKGVFNMDYDWSHLSDHQLGRYGELLVASEFLRYGCDVYRGELDDRGIDLIVRLHEDLHYTIQVKASRKTTSDDPIYMRRDLDQPQTKLWVAFVHCLPEKPAAVYLIPIIENGTVNSLFRQTLYQKKPAYEFTPPKVLKCPQYLFNTSIHLLLSSPSTQ